MTTTANNTIISPRRRSIVVVDDNDLPPAFSPPLDPTPPPILISSIQQQHKQDAEVQHNENNVIKDAVLPTPIDVTDEATLKQELDRLSDILSTLNANWYTRVVSLELLATLCTTNTVLQQHADCTQLLYDYRILHSAQLQDRRSAVIKAACATIISISQLLHTLPHNPTSSALYTELVCYWLTHLYPLVAITIAVISNSATQCIDTVITHVARVTCPNLTSTLHALIQQTNHKHGDVRTNAYKSIASWLTHLNKESIDVLRADTVSLAALQQCVQRGVNDSSGTARTHARSALMAMTTHYFAESQSVRDQMSPSHQKTFDREVSEYNINTQIPESNSAAKPTKSSLRDQMKAMKLSQSDAASAGNGDTEVDVKVPSKPKPTVADPVKSDAVQPSKPAESITQLQRNLLLLSRLLDLNEPIITDKMLNYLLNEHVTETFLSFLSPSNQQYINWSYVHELVDADYKNRDSKPNKRLSKSAKKKFKNPKPDGGRPSENGAASEASQTGAIQCFGADFDGLPDPDIRDKVNYATMTSDEALRVKRSFTVMSILCTPRPTNNLMQFIIQRFDTILYNILSAFHRRNRAANVYHASQILSKLLQLYPNECYSRITRRPGSYFIVLLFCAIAEPPVLEVILTMFAVQVDDANAKKQMIKSLVHEHNYIHGCIAQHLTSTNINFVLPATEFLTCVLDKTFFNQTLYSFFTFKFDATVTLILDTILACNTGVVKNFDACNYLAAFLLKWLDKAITPQTRVLNLEQSVDNSSGGEIGGVLPTKMVDNPLYTYYAFIQTALFERYDVLCNQLTSFVTNNHFKLYHLQVFQFLYHAITLNIEKFDQRSSSQHVVLLDKLFNHNVIGLNTIETSTPSILYDVHSKKANSFYIQYLFKLFITLFQQQAHCGTVVDLLLNQYKLIDRCCAIHDNEAYRHSTLQSHAFLLLQHVRLIAQQHPNSQLAVHVKQNTAWSETLVALESEITKQLRSEITPLRAQVGGDASQYSPGIDVGSAYAAQLGYTNDASAPTVELSRDEQKKLKKKARKKLRRSRKSNGYSELSDASGDGTGQSGHENGGKGGESTEHANDSDEEDGFDIQVSESVVM